MFRAGLTLIRRLICAASLLVLFVCGAEVAVRIYEASSGNNVCSTADEVCIDPTNLTIPSLSIHHELRPMATARVECRDTSSDIEIRTNSLGLRGPEVVVPKPANVYRIVVLGDETIFAPETPESDHFCSLLQARLQQQSNAPIEVINAGIPGHCPLTEYLLFKQRLLGLRPDLVLLHFDWSDVTDDRQIRRRASCDDNGVPQACPHFNLTRTKSAKPHQVWRQQFRLLDWGLNSVSSEWKQQIARQKANSRDADTNPYAWLREERPAKNLSFFNSVGPILDLAQLCRSEHLPFVMMTSPKPWQVSDQCSSGEGVRLAAGVAQDAFYSSRTPFDVLARFSEKANIPFIDGSTAIASGHDAESNFLKYAPRWSATGHVRMSELVAGFVSQRIEGPWHHEYFSPKEQPISHDGRQESPIQRTSGQKTTTPKRTALAPQHRRR